MEARETQEASDDRPVRWRLALALAALGPLGLGLLALAALDPGRTDALYSRGLFPRLRDALGLLSRLCPWSASETLASLALVLVVWRTGAGLWAWARGRRRLANLAGHGLAQTLGTIGILGLAFQLLWGLNHARAPFAQHAGLTVGPVGSAELTRCAALLAAQAQRERAALGEDVDRRCALAGGADPRLEEAWSRAGRAHPALAGPAARVRVAVGSRLLTWARLGGVYSPFTAEPHLNGETPPTAHFFGACHELAHHRGFAREDEANFVGYLVCSLSDDPALRYSGALHALVHVLSALPMEEQRDVMRSLAPALREDLARETRFWARSHPALARIITGANDLYLSTHGRLSGDAARGHTLGVASYGRTVDLLVAHLLRAPGSPQ